MDRASAVHEINNPLYAARNCLALLEQDAPLPLRESPFQGIAREQLTRIAGIIEGCIHQETPNYPRCTSSGNSYHCTRSPTAARSFHLIDFGA
jgi:hypothetical protein